MGIKKSYENYINGIYNQQDKQILTRDIYASRVIIKQVVSL